MARDVKAGRKILVEHDIDFEVNRIREQVLGKSPRGEMPWEREKDLEVSAWKGFDAILTLSRRDRDVIREKTGDGVTVAHLPVCLDSFSPLRPVQSMKRDYVVFVGSFAADFNVDAIRYLLRDIWPRIRREQPDLSLFVVGDPVPGDTARAAQQQGVQFLGYVDDVRTVVSDAKAMLVPLRFGGGIRIRILEAMAYGTAVVSTVVGFSGIEAEPGAHLLVAESPGTFVEHVLTLCRDEVLRKEIETQARAWFERNYTSDSVRERILAVYAGLT
jgi:glycosyltransferase involved in cell wall biosynthesis